MSVFDDIAKKFTKEELQRKFKPLMILPFIFGMLCAVQQSMMGAIGGGKGWDPPLGEPNLPQKMNSTGYLGGLVNVAGGFIISLLICNPWTVRLYSDRNPVDRPPFRWWMPLGGVMFTSVIILVTIGFPSAGAVLTSVLFNVGNIIVSACFDHFGFMAIPKRRVTIMQIVVIALFLGAAILASMSVLNPDDIQGGWNTLYIFFPLFGGIIFAFFISFNISTSIALPYAPQTSLVNYGVAVPLMLIVWGSIYGGYGVGYESQIKWWTYFPGLIEVFMIMNAFLFMPKIGVALYQQFFIIGQLFFGALIDHFAWLDQPARKEKQWMRFLGIGLAAIGALINVICSSEVEEEEESDDQAAKQKLDEKSDPSTTTSSRAVDQMP